MSEMQMNIPVNFQVDTVNEAAEGFVATFTIMTIGNTDMMNLVPSTRPVAAVFITNDDSEFSYIDGLGRWGRWRERVDVEKGEV